MDGKIKLLIAIWALMITADCALSQPDSLWSRRYDMTITGSTLTHDGGYAITGYSWSPDVVYSMVAKLDTVGEVIWENRLEDSFNLRRIVETSDSGVAICGYSGNEFIINKYDIAGEELYSWLFEFEYDPEINDIIEDGDSGYVASGAVWNGVGNRDDFFLLKISSAGEIEWQRIYVDRPRDQECFTMTTVPDGGFILVGHTRENDFGNEINVIRTDEDGEVIWRNHYGTELIGIPANESGHDIIATNDGNFVIAGMTIAHDDQNGHFNVSMLKIDADGEVLWLKTIDLGGEEKGRSIANTMDGGFVLSGYRAEMGDGSGNPFIMKTDHRGNLVWSDVVDEIWVNGGRGTPFNAFVHEDRTFSLITQPGSGLHGFLQKYGRDPHSVADGVDGFLPSWTGLVAAYPNPFNGITTFVFTVGSPADVGIDIFNTLGRRQTELVRRSYPVGQHRLSWDAGGLPSGDYFARMTAGGIVSTRKVSLVIPMLGSIFAC